jgi:hypothetical protein
MAHENPFVMTCALSLALGLGACSSDDHTATGGEPDAGGANGADGGRGLVAFTPPKDPGKAGILFSASGEALALTGYAFPPVQDTDPAFVDGWDVHFRRLLVTIDALRLSENPDSVPGDQSQTGKLVAQVDGPWAVDLARSDPDYLLGKGGPGERAVPIAALSAQNRNGNRAFATDGARYAFGFDVVAASPSVAPYNVNLDAEGLSDYEDMRRDGCTVLYVGTATFAGDKTDPDCYPKARRDFPDAVDFRLCFVSPTSYDNCQNPDNDPGDPFPDEEHQRGIAFKANASVIAQVTIHTDHPFWDSTLHDSPLHFDQYAARVVGDDGGTPVAILEQTKGVDYTAFTDALGHPLDYRYCIEPPTDAHGKFVGAMRFAPGAVPHSTNGSPATGLRDYYDFATYDQSTQGHLNADGLCSVKRRYASPR